MSKVKIALNELNADLTAEELQELNAAENKHPLSDENSPAMTMEQLMQFKRLNLQPRSLTKIISISVILTLMLVTFVFAEEAEPTEFLSEGFSYTLLEDGTAEITKYSGASESLEVPVELDGCPVTSIGNKAFFNCTALTSIAIPDSITSIGDSAFSLCSRLSTITIPDSVVAIGSNPFEKCSDLVRIIVSPDHPALATIDGVLFSKTDKRLVTYPCAFLQTEYAVPQGIRIIGDSAFSSCPSLTGITIPESVTTIGDSVFSSCSGLSIIKIPDSVTVIGSNPFWGCGSLKQIVVSSDHPALSVIDGVLFCKTDMRLVTYPCAFSENEYITPQGIRSIGDYAFFSCRSLTTVTISDSVTTIGDSAFRYCSNLRDFAIPNNVTIICDNAFSSCRSLKTLSIPASVTTIGNRVFSSCFGLTAITIPDSVTSIGQEPFIGCDNLTDVTVEQNSYAQQYCIVNKLPFCYPRSNDWLND